MRSFGAIYIASLCALVAGCSSADDGAAPSTSHGETTAAEVAGLDGEIATGSLQEELRGRRRPRPTNPCAAVSCLAPSSCEVVDGEAVCVPIEPTNPCAAVLCPAPSTCEVVEGQAVCVPIEPPVDACALVRCRAGTHCEVLDGRAACEPDEPVNPCAAVSCLAPSSCEVVDGEAVCVPIEPVNPCAAVSCLAPSTCEVVDGQGVCVAIEPTFCGGIAAFPCPGSGSCVDNPADDCDPERGGADCGGICACNVRALCVQGFAFDPSPSVCGCVPVESSPGECSAAAE